MLSLVELERVAGVLSRELVGARVERWLEPERGRLAFSLYKRKDDAAQKQKLVLEIDARSEVARIGRLERMPRAPDAMPAFTAYLRAHLGRARLEGARIRGGDRQLELRFSAREGEYRLLLSIFGRRSNLYLLDAEGRLLQSLRPLAETRSELAPGEPYRDPAGGAPHAGEDRFAEAEGLALLDAIATHYAEAVGEKSAADERRQLLAAISKERKAASRRLARIESELAESEETNTFQRHGELLKANLGRIQPGADSVVVNDFETGEPVEITLDPKRTPAGNLEATFKRYQKLLRRLAKAGGQVEAARARVASLEALESEVREADSLDEILARDEVRKLIGRRATKSPKRNVSAAPARPPLPGVYRSLPRKLHPRRYKSGDGLEIWVGRSDEANDVLTTRLARGKDLFFHLDGAPGSHVILRTEGSGEPPPESILDACELAVHFSKQKNAGRADVHVVPIKNVKKPKGAKRGLVYVSGGKSIHLRREEARLARVLASRLED